MPDTAKDRLYFDHNATAPLLPAAREAWLQTHDLYWHNPSSPYKPAAKARALLEASRADLAALLGADDPERLLFVSGASE
ncbi:aminotransferase class V-fold PLP-dependent enzyme, partial [Arthrospira platensis SPKY1]|nr:aminotransferase class V-fold PLP-dependent enzyme [Arthrospira platensis SPKY1]